MKRPPAVIVHGLGMARAALSLGHPLTLLSGEGAGAYAGVGWWQALVRAARAECPALPVQDILDCGFASGRALEALRAGQTLLVLRAEPTIWSDIFGRARAQGAELLAEPPPALDLGKRGALRRLPAWLSQEETANPGG